MCCIPLVLRTIKAIALLRSECVVGLGSKVGLLPNCNCPWRQKWLSKGFSFCGAIQKFGEYFMHHRQFLVISFLKENFASELFGSINHWDSCWNPSEGTLNLNCNQFFVPSRTSSEIVWWRHILPGWSWDLPERNLGDNMRWFMGNRGSERHLPNAELHRRSFKHTMLWIL